MQLVRVAVSQPGCYAGADVAAHGNELGVAEVLGHELSPQVGHPADLHPALAGGLGESEAGEGRGNDVKGVDGVAAVGGRVGQQGNDLAHFEKGAGPAVGDNQRDGVGAIPFFVNEMDVEAVDLGLAVVEGVEFLLLGPPVEAGSPVLA